jgi:dimethylhistidine N-methyltransferase
MYDLEFERQSRLKRRAVAFHDRHPPADDFRAAVLEGLGRSQKALPCRFLYDAQGSALFDRICDLPEYYPTRTETGILAEHAGEIVAHVGPHAQLVELGSGSSTKVRILLDALETPAAYAPIDISREHLLEAAQAIQDAYPDLTVDAICADFAQAFDLPPAGRGRRMGFYPGSTIGNFTPAEAQAFLAQWARRLGPGALFLVGVDLRKDAEILERAYDDAQGVTAAFSRNLLVRANSELGADFEVEHFRHEARYDPATGRVAIHLRALRSQTVTLGKDRFEVAAGETIHIEDSWKYNLEDFRAMARRAGFEPVDYWTDGERMFSVHLLEARAFIP